MAAQENHDGVVRFLLSNGANQSLATEDGFTPLAVAMQQGHDKVVAVLLESDTRGKVRLPALHIAAKKDDCKAADLLLQNEHNPDITSKSGFTPLHIAAHYGNENIAKLLLSKGADVNFSAKHNISPLHVAAKWGKSNLVTLLLEMGASIEAKTRDGLTPLHCAARSGHEQVVDTMLEQGAPISCKTKNGLAPLHMAAQGDHVDAARILLYHRAPVDEVTVDYLTALHVAAHCGHVRVAKLLLDRKADPNARALNGFTPLHIACKKNRIKVVELLLKHGASIEATTESGLTPLHVASFMGCMNIVIYLLQNEASPDVPTVRGETPLHLAARANQTDIIRILLRNGAQVDARAREHQTPLHIASRLGNVDIVMLLLQHGAVTDSATKDMYTALHIAAKEGQEEVASVLLENGASLTATTKKGFTPLHLAAKYGNIKVARLLLQNDAPVDAQGKNGVTPLHVASHYDHQNVALLLLDKGASPHATAKNGHTPLHIAARKNQMDIATTLLEYGAKANAESKAGFTPLHLSSQEGHTDMSTLLIEHQANTNHQAKNGLTPLHLCAQEDRVNVATILVKNGAQVDAITKAGYTPLHVASHFGQANMVRFLLQNGADAAAITNVGYTPLHQAAQQGHSAVIPLLLASGAQPNTQTKQGQTALSIAQKLGYISVVETLKVVTEVTTITTTTTTTIEEKYRVVAPETMQETFMSDSEDEGGEDTLLNEQPYRYLTVDEMRSLGDDSLPIDVTHDDRHDSNRDLVSPQHIKETYAAQLTSYTSDNVDIGRHPVNVGFLVSFLVDARGGAMRGCRHSGVRVIVPPRKAPQPLRVTCRYLKRDKLSHPPPLMEGEALASRILELGPVGAKFLGPVIIEVPHFGSLRGREREIVILRSDNGETWREHTVEASEDAIHDVLSESFEKDELSQLEVCDSGRLTRILTTDFPQYFAVVSRIRQEVHAIGPEGGMVSSSVVPQVQAVFPQGALTKKIKVGLQAQPIPADLVAKLLGNRVAVSPIVTVEPRRRKFHKPITLTIPVPQAANKGMINQYSGDAPTLRLLCSITGGTTRAQWEDVTGSTPLTFVNDCVSFTTTVSARFWLMDCRNISDATKMATELYREAIHVPFLAKFVVFSKRVDYLEARLRVFCMTDDKEDKTLEHQEHFTEVAKSRDVEVLEGKAQFVEFAGNLVPVTKSGEQLQLGFRGFRENRLAFTVKVKDPHADPVGRILFMKEAKVLKGEPPQQPVCVLNIVLPEDIIPESSTAESTPHKYSNFNGSAAPARPELRLTDISNLLGSDWESLAIELGLARSDIERLRSDQPGAAHPQHAIAMLRLWLQRTGNKASGNDLQQALQRLGRDDIIHRCMMSCDDHDINLTGSHAGLDQSGFDSLQAELGVSRGASRDSSRETSLRRNQSLDANGFDEQDLMKESESVEELVQSERIEPSNERIDTSHVVLRRSDKQRRERDDREERKYVAEEKEVANDDEEEVKKSVRERTQEIEKRLSQASIDEQQQRRDSQLFQGVSEGLERLDISTANIPSDGAPSWQETKITKTTTTTITDMPSAQGSAASEPSLGGLTATNSKSATAPCLNIDQSKSGEIGRSYDSSVPSQTVVVQEVVTPSIQGIVHGKGAGPEIASSPPKGEVKGTLAVETKSGLPVKFTVDVKKEVKLDANKIEDAIGNDRKQSSDPTQGKEKDGSDQGVEKKSGTEESKEDKEKGDAPSESDSKEGPVVSASSSIQEKLSKEATKKGGSSESEKDTDTTEVDEGKDVSLKDRKSSYNAEKDLKQGDKEKGLKKTAEEANVKQNEDDTKDNSVKMDINETQKLLDVIDGKDAKSDHVGKEAKQQLQEFTEEREKKGAVEEKKHDVKESEKRKEPTEKELTEERKDGGPKKPDSKTSEGTQDIGDGVKRRGSKGSGKGKGLKDGNDTIGVEQDKGSKGSGKDKGAKDSKGSEKDKGPSDSLKRQDSEGIGKGKGSKDSPKKQDSQGSKRDGGPKDCPKHDSKGNEKEKGPKDSPKRQDLKGDKDKGTKDSPKKQNSKGSEKDKDFKESYKGQDPKGSEKDKDIKDSPKRQDSTGGAKSKGVKDNLQGLDPKKSNSGKDKDSPKRQNSSSGEKGKGAKIGVKDFLETEKATDSKEILKERSNQESEKDNDTKESIKTMSGTDKGATSDGGFHSERVDAKNDGKDRKKVLAKEDKENGSNHGEYSEKVPEHEKTDASTTAIVETKEQVLSSGDPGKQNVTVSSEKTTVSTNAVGIKPQVVETVTKVTKPLDFKEKPLLDVVSCTSERDKPKTSETKTQKDEQNAEIKTRVPDQKSDTDPHEPSILQKQISVEATKSFIQLEQAHTMSLLGNDMIPLKVNEQASASSVPGSVPVTSLDKASIEIVPKVEDIENAPKQISEQVLTSVKAETSKTQTEPSCDSAKDPSCTVAKTSEKVPLETAQLIDLGSKTPVNELESSQQPRTLHLVEETVKPKSLDAEKTIQEDETFVEPGKHSVELQGKSDKSGVNTSERPDDKLVKDDIAAKIVKLVENLPKTDDKPMVVDSTSDKPKDYLQKPDETGAKVDEAAKQTGVLPGTVLEQTIDDHTKQFSESSTQQKTSNAEPHFVVGDIPSDIVATTSLLESERLHLNLRETEPSMSSQGWGKQVSSETPKGAVGPADKTFPQSAGASLLTETLTKTISTAVGNEPTISSTAVTKMTSAQGSEASHYEKSAPIQTIETSTTSVSRTRNSVQQPSAAIVHQKSEDSSILVSFPAEVSKAPISAGETISQTIETKTGNGGKSEQVITTTVRKMPLTKEGSIEQAVTITEKTVVEGSPRELKKDWDYEIDSGSFLDDDFLKNTPKISVKETVTVTTFKRASPAKSSPVDVSDVKLTSQSKTKEVSYVTTPTMARRTQSQRRSREERRFPVDVTHAQADYSSDEDTPYTVTEPSDERTEDRYRINSSPEILSVTSHSTSATPQKPSGSLSSEHHKVMFQLGSMDSQDSSPDLPSEAISPSKLIKKESEQFQNRTKEEELAILTELASSALKTPSPVSVTTTQIRTDPGSSNIITQTSSVSFSRSDSREGSQESDLSREEKKLRRVERHFERMASQTLQGEDLPPEERDADFQRMVSQLSTEEMAGSQEQYLQLLDEGGASPDWDSRDPETDDSPEADVPETVSGNNEED